MVLNYDLFTKDYPLFSLNDKNVIISKDIIDEKILGFNIVLQNNTSNQGIMLRFIHKEANVFLEVPKITSTN